MKEIKDVFKEELFYIEKLKYEHNSCTPDIIIRVNRHQYEINYFSLSRFLRKYDIDLEHEFRIHSYPKEYLDNRPLWKKDLDFRMGKNVDFNHKNYITISMDFLEKNINLFIKD